MSLQGQTMKFSEQWLREWANPPVSSEELTEQLTLSGLEVDWTQPVSADFSGVVVGHVLEVKQHPDADRLRVCLVKVDEEEPLTIVCGGQNVRENLKVPVAKVNAVLPGNFKIKKSKLRGVESCGMICSESELGLAQESQGIMELPDNAPIGEDIRDYLQLNDKIIDIDLTPNRGDCMSILGIAREVTAINKIPMVEQPTRQTPIHIRDEQPITVTANKDCPRYLGRIIKNINTHARTPLWMQEKLRRSGVRSIHPVVDVTNYVLLELGQPLHAFDLAKLQGGIQVRHAKKGESIHLLDEQTLELDDETLLIADEQKPLALAGIMGGHDSGITDQSSDIFLESAFFTPASISKTARKYSIHTDSSHRFERGVDPHLQRRAIERASELLLEIVGGDIGPLSEVSSPYPDPQTIFLRRDRIKRILGISLSDEDIATILKNLKMTLRANEKGWEVTPPSFRFDLTSEIDLIEELARIHGYSAIPTHKMTAQLQFLMPSETKLDVNKLRSLLVNRGYQEAITYSFVDPRYEKLMEIQKNPLQLLNPISSELSTMRSNHWAGLLKAFEYNYYRQQPRVRLFEIGLCFLNEPTGLQQQLRLGGLISGLLYQEQWGEAKRMVDFYDIKQDIESLLALTGHSKDFNFLPYTGSVLHPGKSAIIKWGDKDIGSFGALHPSIQQQLDINQPLYLFDLHLESIIPITLPTYEAISKFPAIRRDIAVVVERDVPGERIRQKILDSGGELLKNVQIFDVYQGKGIDLTKKSVAFCLSFQHISRTLVDNEINEAVQSVVNALRSEFNATLRD